MRLTHGAVLLGCTGTGLICREEWAAIALATALEAPQTLGDTRNPIVKFILARDQGTLWLASSHTHGSILVYVLPKRAQHTHMDQINKYLLSLHFVLLIFENIHLAVLGLSCGMQTLRCSMCNLVP